MQRIAAPETVFRQDRLALFALDKLGKQVRRGRPILEHNHPILGADIERWRDLNDVQPGDILLGQHGVGTIGEKHVGLPARL